MNSKIDTAFIFAAGRGERLRPLTDTTPKPLLEIKGRPILSWILDEVEKIGLKKVVFNAWHLKEQIFRFVESESKKRKFAMAISEETELLGTGGGLKKALPLIGPAPFLALNGDCLWKGDLNGFVESASKNSGFATWWLTTKEKDQTEIGVKGNRIVQIGNLWQSEKPEEKPDTLGVFTGIQYIKDVDAAALPDKGCLVRDYTLKRLSRGDTLFASTSGLASWTDIGTVERLKGIGV